LRGEKYQQAGNRSEYENYCQDQSGGGPPRSRIWLFDSLSHYGFLRLRHPKMGNNGEYGQDHKRPDQDWWINHTDTDENDTARHRCGRLRNQLSQAQSAIVIRPRVLAQVASTQEKLPYRQRTTRSEQ
jgi:hypothetical protein